MHYNIDNKGNLSETSKLKKKEIRFSNFQNKKNQLKHIKAISKQIKIRRTTLYTISYYKQLKKK